MGRLNFYKTEASYNADKDSFVFPTVAYVEENEGVKWMNPPQPEVPNYLKFTVLDDGDTFTLTLPSSINSSHMTSVSYSLDNGSTWTTTNIPSEPPRNGTVITTPKISQGDSVLWKGIGSTLRSHPKQNSSVFSSSAKHGFNISGNIMSLLYGDDFENIVTFPQDSTYNFSGLFSSSLVVSAENLILPATTLTYGCYQQMFFSCTELTTAPVLPATTLVGNCYQQMFQGCSSLNYIKAMFTVDPIGSGYTSSWVDGVYAGKLGGIFVMNANASYDPDKARGVDGIPVTWNVETASE